MSAAPAGTAIASPNPQTSPNSFILVFIVFFSLESAVYRHHSAGRFPAVLELGQMLGGFAEG
jgi:hypothetical protein